MSFRLPAALTGALFAAAAVTACNGTAVYDREDPTACDTGHGCESVVCTCGDGSRIADTTCENGSCREASSMCEDRCADFEGVAGVATSVSDTLAVPACSALCLRIRVNGCDLGCDVLTSECVPSDDTCDEAASRFWSCVIGEGVMSCDDGALRIQGCEDEIPSFCATPDSGLD